MLNALNVALMAELHDALEDAENDENIGAIVITDGGDRAFCAGADIPEIQALTPMAARDFSLSLHEYTKHMERIKKPITEDSTEGLQACVEKRKAEFKGK